MWQRGDGGDYIADVDDEEVADVYYEGGIPV